MTAREVRPITNNNRGHRVNDYHHKFVLTSTKKSAERALKGGNTTPNAGFDVKGKPLKELLVTSLETGCRTDKNYDSTHGRVLVVDTLKLDHGCTIRNGNKHHAYTHENIPGLSLSTGPDKNKTAKACVSDDGYEALTLIPRAYSDHLDTVPADSGLDFASLDFADHASEAETVEQRHRT